MTQTKKFSQFNGPSPIQTGDIVVGLRVDTDGTLDNWQFTGVGSGSGGAVTATITQPGNTLDVGNWVRIEGAGQYVVAQANTTQNAEVIGVVIAINVNGDPSQFTLQQSGYLEGATAIFGALTSGDPYYLSSTNAGFMANTEPTGEDEVSRPVYIPDGYDAGWVVPYRGFVANGDPGGGGGGGTGTDTSIVTIAQIGHGFFNGAVVRVDTPVLGAVQYALARADTYANSLAVGVVIDASDPNSFVLQTSGYNIGAFSVDDLPIAIQGGRYYYLSETMPGRISLVQPVIAGRQSKPIFSCEQGIAEAGIVAGYILEQRSIGIEDIDNQNIHTVTKANAFQKGQWVYIQGPADDTYALAKADTFASSQVAGVVISDFDPNTFMVQQAGYVTGAIDGTYVDGGAGAIINGGVLYLSPIVAGNLTPTIPTTVGQYTKPCYVQENLATLTGEILPQRPLAVGAAGGGGVGTGAVIQNITSTLNVRMGVSAFINYTWYALPGLTATITPLFASSNIRITVNIPVTTPTRGHVFYTRLLRNGVVVPTSVGTGVNPFQPSAGTWVQNGQLSGSIAFQCVDPAANVLPAVYTLECAVNGHSVDTYYPTVSSYPQNIVAIATMTLEEIA